MLTPTLNGRQPSHVLDAMTWGWYQFWDVGLATAAWTTANRAFYVPVQVPVACVVRKIGWIASGTAAGNCDVGLYNTAGTRLFSTGSQANTTTNATRAIDITDQTVSPGTYYLGLNNSTTTDTFPMDVTDAVHMASTGVLVEALGSVTLPATASWSLTTLSYVPVAAVLHLSTEIS